jgi:hypothetical protein
MAEKAMATTLMMRVTHLAIQTSQKSSKYSAYLADYA